jgi:DNA-binding SARP family transcriptional activator
MSNFGLRDSPDFDDWQMQQAETWRGELSQTLQLLVQGHIGQGDLESAISDARRWLALDRLDEAAHGQLMRLYTWIGRRPAALQQFQECARILHEQLGVLPQESLRALCESIRSGGFRPPSSAVDGRVDAETHGTQLNINNYIVCLLGLMRLSLW